MRLKGIHLAMQSGIHAADAAFAAVRAGDVSASGLVKYRDLINRGSIRRELYPVRNVHQAFGAGLAAGTAFAGLAWLTNGRWPAGPLASEAGHERLTSLSGYYPGGPSDPDVPSNAVKVDRALTFDKLTNVHYSGTRHDEDQPVHLLVQDTDICRTRCREEYGNPCVRFCPANVYEMVDDGTGNGRRLQINASNCVHCKTCDIMDPYQDHRLGASRRRRRSRVRRDVAWAPVPAPVPPPSLPGKSPGRGPSPGSARRSSGCSAEPSAGASRAWTTTTPSWRAGASPSSRSGTGGILPATWFWRDRGIVVMTSQNFDGEWIARIIRRFGYGTARGSTSRGARRALVQLKRDVAAGRPAAFTVDGPRGPARRVQPGAVWLAGVTGAPILPFHIEAERHWSASSWDRTQVPRPFSTVAVAIGAPFHVPDPSDDGVVEAHRSALEWVLSTQVDRAAAMLRT